MTDDHTRSQQALRPWRLKCLLCGQEDDSLTRIQEHVMDSHDASIADLRNQTSKQVSNDHYIYSLPDGREWLEATR